MSVEPEEFSRSAAAIIAGECREIDFRNAASRAYYAAYHHALSLAIDLEAKATINGGYHELVIKTLTTAGNNPIGLKCRRVGILLSTMRQVRQRADYQLDLDFKRSDTESVITTAAAMKVTLDEAFAMKA